MLIISAKISRLTTAIRSNKKGEKDMRQNEIVKLIQSKNDKKLSRDEIKSVIDTYHDVILENLYDGNDVRLPGLGVFEVYTTKPTTSYDMWNKRRIEVKSHKRIKFRVYKTLKDAMKEI